MVCKDEGVVVVLDYADESDQDMIDQRMKPVGDMFDGPRVQRSGGNREWWSPKDRIEPCGVSCKWLKPSGRRHSMLLCQSKQGIPNEGARPVRQWSDVRACRKWRSVLLTPGRSCIHPSAPPDGRMAAPFHGIRDTTWTEPVFTSSSKSHDDGLHILEGGDSEPQHPGSLGRTVRRVCRACANS